MTQRVVREMAALVCYLGNLKQKNLKNFSFLQEKETKDCYYPGAQGRHTFHYSSGGSRIFLRRGVNFYYFANFFAEKCMKIKEFGPRGGVTFLATSLDPPMNSSQFSSFDCSFRIKSQISCCSPWNWRHVSIALASRTESASYHKVYLLDMKVLGPVFSYLQVKAMATFLVNFYY